MAEAYLVLRLCTFPDIKVFATRRLPDGFNKLIIGMESCKSLGNTIDGKLNIFEGIEPNHISIESTGKNQWIVKENQGNIYECNIEPQLILALGNYFLIGEDNYIMGTFADECRRVLYTLDDGKSASKLYSINDKQAFSIGVEDTSIILEKTYLTKSSTLQITYNTVSASPPALLIQRDKTFTKEYKEAVWVLTPSIVLNFKENTRRLFRIGKIVVAVDYLYSKAS